jgi:hypothetical protein
LTPDFVKGFGMGIVIKIDVSVERKFSKDLMGALF